MASHPHRTEQEVITLVLLFVSDGRLQLWIIWNYLGLPLPLLKETESNIDLHASLAETPTILQKRKK